MFTPFDYQDDCLAVLSAVRQEGRKKALVVMATALGKTVTAAFDVKNWLEAKEKKRILYLCHQNDILHQAKTTFEVMLGKNYSYGYFHGKNKTMHDVDVLFASLQTMEGFREIFQKGEFAYIVVDESHHSQADSYKQTIQYFEPEFLLGITATPDRLDELNIREIFGAEVYSLPLEEAMAHGYLVPVDYRLLTDEILLSQRIETEKGKRSIAELNKTIFIPRRDEEIARIISEQISAVPDPQTIIFCTSIVHCNRMAEVIPNSFTIHSRVPEKERAVRVEMFRQGLINTVLVVDSFNEGVDIPAANILVFLRSTNSRTIFFQQLGRGLRKAEGKEFVLVLDFVANCERILMIDALFQEVKKLSLIDGEIKPDHQGKKKESITLNINSSEFKEKIVPILNILKHSLYPTWQEASEAAIRLGLVTQAKYKKGYKGDNRLPSSPYRIYKNFPGWALFAGRLEKNYYPTVEEASTAAQTLGIKTKTEYAQRYQEDSRLPASPSYSYIDDFPTWAVFLGKKKKVLYPTWQEASEAASKLGITTKEQYKKRHTEDPRLPADPPTFRGCSGWREFFGRKRDFYSTWEEVATVCKRNNVTSASDYANLCESDERLPKYPHDVYANFPGFVKMLGAGRSRVEYPYSTWQEASEAAKKLGITSSVSYRKDYKKDNRLYADPSSRYSNFPGWSVFLGSC